MATKTVNTRIQLKSDTEANWRHSALIQDGGDKTTGTTFVPLKGELIIYSPDNGSPTFSRLKVGDGEHSVPQLPFIDAGTINGSSLPENNIILCASTRNFPRVGDSEKLYIDLANNRIFCFAPTIGYTQLSHFTYLTTTQTITTIKSWSAGVMTLLEVNNNKLLVTNGTAPSLETEDIVVVTDIIENTPEVINNGGND